MTSYLLDSSCRVILRMGDLTTCSVDAIVNAANERMLGGGGVDGAIHRAAGPLLQQACAAVPEVSPGVRCPTGEARLTPGFALRARHVIHTVGPVYHSVEQSAPLLVAAHRSCLVLAGRSGFASIAFPAISCGIYGYPAAEAAPIALTTARDHAGSLHEIHFVLFGPSTHDAWAIAADRLLSRECGQESCC